MAEESTVRQSLASNVRISRFCVQRRLYLLSFLKPPCKCFRVCFETYRGHRIAAQIGGLLHDE